MPRKSARRASGNPISKFLLRPVVQFSILGVAALAVILILAFGGSGQLDTANLPASVTVDQAYKLYQQGNVFFLDVREQFEWDEYHAPNSTLIPLGDLPNRLNEVPRNQPIVVVCRSGNRSQQGRDTLLQAGFTNVTSMDGGLNTWRSKNYPIAP
jgi:rhodanese-related sulfurtransferase